MLTLPGRMELDELLTERRSDTSGDLDLRPTRALVQLMNEHDAAVPGAVAAAAEEIVQAIDAVVERLDLGGRLVYVGAGPSGRLAALDAAECESSFSAPAGQVVAVVAGDALASAWERDAAEVDAAAG